MFSSLWSSAYKAILSINLALEAVDKHPGVLRPDDAAMIKGELLGLRAFVHLDLVRLFGPAPSRSGAMDALAVPYADSSDILRRDRLTLNDIIYNKIISELTDGVLNSAVDGESNWGRYRQLRMNYYAATLVKARAYLWVMDYDNALAEAASIVDDPQFSTAFPWVEPARLLANRVNPDRVFSTECMFGFYTSPMSDIYDRNFAGTLSETIQLYPCKGYTAQLFPNTSDYRYQAQWEASMSLATDMDFIKYKGFRANQNRPEFWATYFGLIRKSEAYLIAAECKAMKNDLSGAVGYLNPLLEARGLQPFAGTESAGSVKNEIKLEYCRDMRGEGQIFFLHKRNWQSFYDNPTCNECT